MARNKNSTALFDVIHAAKKPPKASPSASIPTPRWWGKDRKENAVKKVPAAAPVASTENVGRQQSWLTAAKKSAGLSSTPVAMPAEPVSVNTSVDPEVDDADRTGVEQTGVEQTGVEQTGVEQTTAETVAPAAPKTRFIDRFVNRTLAKVEPVADATADVTEASVEPVATMTESLPVVAVNDKEWTDSEFVQVKPAASKPAASKPAPVRDRDPMFRVDPNSKEFRFRLSYGGMIAIGFIVLMALAIAFIAGTRTSPETAQLESSPAATTKEAGKEAGIDSLPTEGLAVAVPKPEASRLGTSPNVMDVGHRTRPAVTLESAVEKPPAPLLPLRPTRDIGMNYVVIQSYAEQDLAQKACDFLNQSGVSCTLVQGPAEWAPHDWYSVIGLQPFAKRDPALADYERKVRTIGGKFSNNVLNQFDPRAYTWRENSDMGQ